MPPHSPAYAAHTPLIRQYLDIKSRHPESILFFRVGDFYEMFFEDAEEGSRLLGITLTSRNNGASADVPLAGVPAKAVDEYLPKLVSLGRSVAVCDQVEEAAEAEGLVRPWRTCLPANSTFRNARAASCPTRSRAWSRPSSW
ncbi:MAG: hypothetical protein P8Y15_06370 [Gemmatimonadales bacterium]